MHLNVRSSRWRGDRMAGGISSFSKFIDVLLKGAGKVISDVIFGLAKKVSETEPVDEKSSVSDIDNVIDIFEIYKSDIRKKAYSIEEALYNEVIYYIEELRNFFDDNDTLLGRYGISRRRIEREIQSLLNGMRGYIDNEVCKSISLNNRELRDIIGMVPGTQKKQTMEDYANKVFNKVLDTFCRQIRYMLSELFEEVKEETVCVIEVVEERVDRNRHQLKNIDADNYEEQLEMMIVRAGYMMVSCNALEELLEG